MDASPFRADLLAGRIALVTGGGSGLGRAIALEYAAHGADVAVLGRTRERLEDTAHAVTQSGRRAHVCVADVRDAAAVDATVAEASAALGGIDVLVNNAAGNFLCPSEDLSANAFAAVTGIVLHGTFHCTRAVGRGLLDRGTPGAILNIVTTYAESGTAFAMPSAAAKAGVLVMTRSLAVEWAKHAIRVNAIAPGPFPTSGAWERLVLTPDMERAARAHVPLGRFGEPHELARLATYMVSGAASYMTGACVALDGGEQWAGSGWNDYARLTREQLAALGVGAR